MGHAMSDSGHTGRQVNEVIAPLLQEVAALPDILFVMGKGPQAVMEGWCNPERTQVSLQDGWVAVERFVEGPDVHDPQRQAFSIRFLGQDGEPLLMIFFGGMYDDAGDLREEKVGRFRALQVRFGLG